jgi:glycosyltransferase involved in cell wall biosynthesis
MISPHFPPDSSAGTHRVRLLAPHLEAYGWRPTVLTVDEHAYEGRIDPALRALVPASLDVERIHALSPRLTRTVGIGDLGLRALPGLRRAAWKRFERDAFDAVFITIYPSYPAVLGPMIKRRFGVPFILDYQDPWVGAWGREVGGGADGAVDSRSRLTRALAERLEPRVLRMADGVTAVSERTFQEAINRTGARPRVTSTRSNAGRAGRGSSPTTAASTSVTRGRSFLSGSRACARSCARHAWSSSVSRRSPAAFASISSARATRPRPPASG